MTDFNLNIPSKEELKKTVEESLIMDNERETMISDISKQKAEEILNADTYNLDDRQALSKAIETFGQDVIVSSTEKNTILQKRLSDLSKIGGESQLVADGLDELSTEVESLNPAGIDVTDNGFLSKIFNPVKKYFKKYQTADETIGKIIDTLEEGAQTLRDDNTTLEIEYVGMLNLSKQLVEKRRMGKELDDYLTHQINKQKSENADPNKIRFLEEEVLFPLRQRMIDFDQMLAVNQQGMISMETIKRNNYELIRSVERAKTVTVSALRTAVMVAGALYNQNLVLSKIKAINETTNNMIATTSRMLKTQGAEIQKQAISANIDMETLKTAFNDALQAFDEINTFKQKALPQMKTTLAEFDTLIAQGQTLIDNIENTKQVRSEYLPGEKQKRLS